MLSKQQAESGSTPRDVRDPLFPGRGSLSSVRHWGVAARVDRGVCVNTLGFGHGTGG